MTRNTNCRHRAARLPCGISLNCIVNALSLSAVLWMLIFIAWEHL
jgi:hypothetical protein